MWLGGASPLCKRCASDLGGEGEPELERAPDGAGLPRHEPRRAAHNYRRFLWAVGAELGDQKASADVAQGVRPLHVAVVPHAPRKDLEMKNQETPPRTQGVKAGGGS